jgi:protein-tyrosine phosphatase
VIDLHAHILPGLDDGPLDLDGSAAIASAAVAGGTTVLAATSHINRSFALEPAQLAEARARVTERLARDRIPLEVVQGGEISAGRVEGLTDEELAQLTLGDSGWILLECPLSPRAPSIERVIEAVRRRGFDVLLAHPERSPTFAKGPALLRKMIALGARTQVTAGAFDGEFGGTVRRAAFAMLDHGLVHVIASDAHDPIHRTPDLRRARAALEDRYPDGAERFEELARTAPAALLAGRPIADRQAGARGKGGLLRRLRPGG